MSSIDEPGMDLYKTIRDLYAEKERLERVIASLEELQRTAAEAPVTPGEPKRRGRRSMGAKERQDVSQRMKNYWAKRREAKTQSKSQANK